MWVTKEKEQMKGIKDTAIITLVLCLFVVIGIVVSHLALTDIYHGIESSLENEWWIVRITFIFVGLLVVSAAYLSLKLFQRDA